MDSSIEESKLLKIKKAKNVRQTYTLPSWRVTEIILLAIQFLSDEEYWKDDFDYQKVISDEGIMLKAYSLFKENNLLELQKISLSLWNEGLCLVDTDKETNRVCRMIAYNDTKNAVEIMQIILHEYAHILFGHTEQSMHGEAEAILFSAITTFMIIAEQQFHFVKLIAKENDKKRFFDGMKQGFMKQFASKEVI
ncbi:hypothetical protein [Treponema sp.]|uniref:hypothetical protein n=1 Tax=Treponema sp. TaxID=166 RepID=UPI003F0D6399